MNLTKAFKTKLSSRENLIAFMRYLLIGISVYVFYIGGTTICVEMLDLPIMYSNVTFYVLSIFLAYIANYYWSFKSDEKHSRAFIKYIGVSAIGLVLNGVFIYTLSVVLLLPIWISTTAFSGLWPLVSFVVQKKLYLQITPI